MRPRQAPLHPPDLDRSALVFATAFVEGALVPTAIGIAVEEEQVGFIRVAAVGVVIGLGQGLFDDRLARLTGALQLQLHHHALDFTIPVTRLTADGPLDQ